MRRLKILPKKHQSKSSNTNSKKEKSGNTNEYSEVLKQSIITNPQKEKNQKLDKNPQPPEENKGRELGENWKEKPPNLSLEINTPKTSPIAIKPPRLIREQPEASILTSLGKVKPKNDQIHQANSMES